MALSDRQKDLLSSLTVVVGGGLILLIVTEYVMPAMRDGAGPSLDDPATQVVLGATLMSMVVLLIIINHRTRREITGTWTVRPGEFRSDTVVMKRGETLTGVAKEGEGATFNLVVMTPDQADRLTGGDRSAGSMREYSGKGRYKVRWTAPEDGTWHLVLDLYRKNRDRTVELDLWIEGRGDPTESMGENEEKVLRAVRGGKGTPVSKISSRSGLSEATVRKYLDRLKRKGLVEKSRDGQKVLWSRK